MNKHKWHDEIVAWAGGAEIEKAINDTYAHILEVDKEWAIDANPQFNDTFFVFRIKPQPAEYLYVYQNGWCATLKLERDENQNQFYLGKIEVQHDRTRTV